MNKIWRDVYKDNYHKSLDHRSFYFKQLDKKGLTAKTFVSQVSSYYEARYRQNEDDAPPHRETHIVCRHIETHVQ